MITEPAETVLLPYLVHEAPDLRVWTAEHDCSGASLHPRPRDVEPGQAGRKEGGGTILHDERTVNPHPPLKVLDLGPGLARDENDRPAFAGDPLERWAGSLVGVVRVVQQAAVEVREYQKHV